MCVRVYKCARRYTKSSRKISRQKAAREYEKHASTFGVLDRKCVFLSTSSSSSSSSSLLILCCRWCCCCCYCCCSHSPFRLPLSCSLVISLSSIAFLLAWFGFCWLSFWLLVCVNFSFIEHGNFFKLFFCSHDMCGVCMYISAEYPSEWSTEYMRVSYAYRFFSLPFFIFLFDIFEALTFLCYTVVVIRLLLLHRRN